MELFDQLNSTSGFFKTFFLIKMYCLFSNEESKNDAKIPCRLEEKKAASNSKCLQKFLTLHFQLKLKKWFPTFCYGNLYQFDIIGDFYFFKKKFVSKNLKYCRSSNSWRL